MNENNAQNGAKKGARTNRSRPYVAMVSVLDLADGDKPELVERLAGLAGDDGHEHGGRLVGHVVQGDLAGGAGGRGRLHSGRSGGCGGRGSGLFGGRGRRCASAGGEGEYHRQREKKDKCFFHGV